MVKLSNLLVATFGVLLVLNGCLARQSLGVPPQLQNECNLDNLDVLQATETIKSEAGQIEYWDHNHPQLRCVGVSVARYVIEQGGLYLPTFFTSPKISYVVQGSYMIITLPIKLMYISCLINEDIIDSPYDNSFFSSLPKINLQERVSAEEWSLDVPRPSWTRSRCKDNNKANHGKDDRDNKANHGKDRDSRDNKGSVTCTRRWNM